MNAVLVTLALLAPAELPEVRYTTTVVTRSWEPIALAEVERMVEQAVEEPLTAPGKMRFVRSEVSALGEGDYVVRVAGRFVEEAERFTVYLSFGPGKQDDLPSLVAAQTSDALGRKSRAEMERRIRETARRAAARLAEALSPWLDRARIDVAGPEAQPVLPMQWGEIEIPEVTDRRKAIRTLMDPRAPDHARGNALREVKGHAFDQQPARNAIEHCVLRDPSPELRARCVQALAPVARAHVPTQRILLHAMRTDVEERVLDALAKVSQGFVGLSRLETVATWLHMVATDATPARAAEKVARLLSKEKDVPNLEVAVAKCLQQESVVYGKRYACAKSLLPRIPAERRPRVVWRYLQEASVFGSGERLTYEAVLAATMEDRKHPPSPAMSALMLDLAERPATGRLRYKATYLAGRYAPATERTIERLLALSHEPRLSRTAIQAAVAVVRREPSLAPATIAAFDALERKATWYPQPARSNPYEELEKAKKRLVRMVERGK